jgi:hypothetical protein
LNDIKELLEAIGCTEEQKVASTTYKLSGKAKSWWQARKVLFAMELDAGKFILCDMFKEEFNIQFCPKVV